MRTPADPRSGMFGTVGVVVLFFAFGRCETAQTQNMFVSQIHENDGGLKKVKDLARQHGLTVRDGSINNMRPNSPKNADYILKSFIGPRIKMCSTMGTAWRLRPHEDTSRRAWIAAGRRPVSLSPGELGWWIFGCGDAKGAPEQRPSGRNAA